MKEKYTISDELRWLELVPTRLLDGYELGLSWRHLDFGGGAMKGASREKLLAAIGRRTAEGGGENKCLNLTNFS